jgi:hypothetical protein
LFFDSVIVLGFGEWLWAVFESVWVERFSELIVFVFNNECGWELISDFLSVLLLDMFEKRRDVDIFIPFLFILFAFESLDLDEVSHGSMIECE